MNSDATRSVSMLIPGLFGPALAGARVWVGLCLPTLEQWLTRAATVRIRCGEFERGLIESFGGDLHGDRDPPVAAVTRQWDRRDAGNHFWLRADPVHVRADRVRLVMIGNTLLNIAADEQAQLVGELNALLREDGYELGAVNMRRWYLRLKQDPDVRTT